MVGAAHRGDVFTGPGSGSSSGAGPQTASNDCLLQCLSFSGNPAEYAACLAVCEAGPVVQTVSNTVSSVQTSLQAVNDAFQWLTNKANWLRIAKIVGRLLLIITGLVPAVVAVSQKAADSPIGQAALKAVGTAAIT